MSQKGSSGADVPIEAVAAAKRHVSFVGEGIEGQIPSNAQEVSDDVELGNLASIASLVNPYMVIVRIGSGRLNLLANGSTRHTTGGYVHLVQPESTPRRGVGCDFEWLYSTAVCARSRHPTRDGGSSASMQAVSLSDRQKPLCWVRLGKFTHTTRDGLAAVRGWTQTRVAWMEVARRGVMAQRKDEASVRHGETEDHLIRVVKEMIVHRLLKANYRIPYQPLSDV